MAVLSWTTRDGEVIPVKDMEIDHMHRCIHLLARKRAVGAAMLLDALDALRYAANAPDGAADAAHSEAEELMNEAYIPEATPLRIEYAIKHNKAIAAMARRLKKARVDYLKTPPLFDPKSIKRKVAR